MEMLKCSALDIPRYGGAKGDANDAFGSFFLGAQYQ